MASPDDKLVRWDHSKKLQEAYLGPSELKIISGEHNGDRPKQHKVFVAEFFAQKFNIYNENISSDRSTDYISN